MNVLLKRVPLLPVLALLFAPCGLVPHASGIEVTLTWGIRKLDYPDLAANGTTLCEARGTEFTVDGFNARYAMELYDTGDGTFDETAGFETMCRIDATNAVDAVVLFNWSESKRFCVPGEIVLPLTYVGDLDIIDPDGEIYDDEDSFYQERWDALHFVTVVRDKNTGAMYRISETPGGEGFLAREAFSGIIDVSGGAMNPGAVVNQQPMTVHCDSKKAYLGAPLPARCVWMADLGLTTNDLAGVSERRIALATALGMKPDQVADVKLELGEIDLKNGTVAYSLDAVAPDGTTSAVTALKYGAELRLLSGTELGRWTETNVVDVANGRTVQVPTQVPTDGNAGFYRLELVLGP